MNAMRNRFFMYSQQPLSIMLNTKTDNREPRGYRMLYRCCCCSIKAEIKEKQTKTLNIQNGWHKIVLDMTWNRSYSRLEFGFRCNFLMYNLTRFTDIGAIAFIALVKGHISIMNALLKWYIKSLFKSFNQYVVSSKCWGSFPALLLALKLAQNCIYYCQIWHAKYMH